MEVDNLHINFRAVNGYQLPFIFVVSAREAGKSTAFWLQAYREFQKNRSPIIVIRRLITHLTTAYIDDIAEILRKFYDEDIKFKYKQADLKSGIVDVYLNDERFIRFIALNVKITAVKSLVLRNVKYVLFDEFICNPRWDEKYLSGEVQKFLEIYNTFNRESHNMTCYFLGNPYSYYNPYFMYFGIRTETLERGKFYTDNKRYVLWLYNLKPELIEYIKERNPLYQFEDEYTKYAFFGENINDKNIIVESSKPDGYVLQYVFKIQDRILGVYRNDILSEKTNFDYYYYIEFVDYALSKRRNIICFDFEEMMDKTIILSRDERFKFENLRKAMRKRHIAFKTIECYYLFIEVYNNL